MERSLISEVFGKENGKVLLKGWVHDSRDLSKVRFIVLKDRSGRIQITGVNGKTDDKVFDLMDKITKESAVQIIGEVKDSPKAPGGKEILPDSIEVIAEAESPLPIDVSDFSKTELPKRIDYRFLDLHRRKTQAIFKIQDSMLQSYREFMSKEGAIEALFPGIIGSSSEGGTETYTLKYFEKKAYLSQSCQLYKQMVACAMEKCYAVFTVWRAEKHNTVRHLNESRQFDYEQCFSTDKEVMDVLYRCVKFMAEKINERNKEDLELLEVNLKIPKVKYLTFKECNDLLKKEGVKIEKTDLTGEGEKVLDKLFPDTVVFVHDWPLAGKTFYIMPKDADENAELSNGFDAIYKGMEISSGGQRIHIPELLEKRLKVHKLNPKDFKAYIDSFRYGAPPHAGWGVGVERLTMQFLGLANIREAVLFPRDRNRLTP